MNSQNFDSLFAFADNFNAAQEMAKINTPLDISELWKIKLLPNDKVPPKNYCWSKDDKLIVKNIEPNEKQNVGILTGKNNIMILDIDVKNGGLDAFNEYVREFGNIDTYCVKTCRNGYHYYFNATSKNNDDNELIKDKITNSTNYRGVGIDIRCGKSGYVVAPGSVVRVADSIKSQGDFNDGKYTVCKNMPIIDMPSNLISWLTAFKMTKPSKTKNDKKIASVGNAINEYEYDITDEKFEEIIYKLDSNYLNNYSDWLRVTTVCKCHEKFNIWDEWSKKSSSYNRNKNITMWNHNKGGIDINYLCSILKIDRIQKHKKINYDISRNETIDYIEYNNNYVFDKSFEDNQYDYKTFQKYDTSILKACCGTGKTTAVAEHVEQYMKENPELKFLSIVDRTSLADQHVKSFKNINMESYQDSKIDACKASSYVVCINSLHKFAALTKKEKNKYIVFIDEITSFLNITHNKTLDNNIKYIYNMLVSIIKHAHKVIIGDAIILDNTFDFLKNRITQDKKTLFITNNFKKFEGVPAVHVKSERLMLQKLINQCKEEKPFLFGCDSATIVTTWMNTCMSAVPESKHHKFILLTADSKFNITDAEKQFKDKYVFYSPKITYGVDFSIDTPQNVYIYQKGQTIMPNGTYQQTTRCRNIETLYYYSDVKEHDLKYESLEDVKETLKKNIDYFNESNQRLYNVSTTYDEDDEKYKIVENSFFNLYSYTEYINDIYNTNMTKHYQELLIENGFIMSEEGKTEKLDKEEKTEIKELTQEIKEKLFEEYLECDNKTLDKYDSFNKHIKFLNIPIFIDVEDCDERGIIETVVNKELLIKYKNEIMDKHVLQDHLNVIRLLKTDHYINEKLRTAKENSYDIKNMTMMYSKIKAIRNLETKYNIKPLEIDYTNEGEINMSDSEYKYIKNTFRISREKPENYKDLRKIYSTMIRHMTSNDLIKTVQGTKGKDRKQILYSIDDDIVKYHLELNKYSNPDCKHFHNNFVEKYKIPRKTNTYNFINECEARDGCEALSIDCEAHDGCEALSTDCNSIDRDFEEPLNIDDMCALLDVII